MILPRQPDTDSDTIVLPHVKDDTDTHYAAKWLLENGYTQVTMLGALGGARLEHTIANLSTGLFLAEHGVDVVLADTASEIHYLVPGKDLTLQRGKWQYLSVFPWDGKLIGVDIEGAYYPLHGTELVPDFPLGVSNEFVEPTVTLALPGRPWHRCADPRRLKAHIPHRCHSMVYTVNPREGRCKPCM